MHESPAHRPDASALASLAWDDIRFFVAVAREGSLSGAARQLRVEHSTVARRVGALESHIGVRLFDRLPRSWALTDEGQALLEPAVRLEQEVLAFARAAAANAAEQGTVRVSAPPAFASHFIVPLWAAQADRWPGIALDIVGELRSANLQRRDADIAIRFMRPTEPGLAARKLGQLAFRLYAAPVWLTRAEADWCFLGYSDSPGNVPHQQLLAALAGTRPFVLRSNDLTALHNACRGGLGLAMLPDFMARGDAALIEVPGEGRPVMREVWSVVHPDVRRSPRVRAVADALAEMVGAHAGRLA
ncbi:LysR family transcriptional regulator [Variovorax boronicumulans]|uniref:LysR family transcriptional regulator n=1 Tax=Variovorax boronicumulans TaxID=436515 RepID=UPI002475C3CE|nr:LysR family transcriptional regulator [Variovorax boronicumulans]